MAISYHLKAVFVLLPQTVFLAAFALKPLQADPAYGYVANVQYGSSLPPDTAGDGGSFQQALDTAIPLQTSYALLSSPSFYTEATANYTAIDLSNDTLYPIYADVGVRQLDGYFAQLHSWTIASTSIGDPNVNGGAAADALLIWIDHLFFYGAPAGTPVQLAVTVSLDGSLIASGGYYTTSYALSRATMQGGFELDVTGAPSQSYGTVIDNSATTIFNSAVGQTPEFEEELGTYISGVRSFSIEANFADTANVYISVLTPGVSLGSASGYDYAAPVESVPEPSCFGLVSCTLLGLTLWRVKRKVTQLHWSEAQSYR